ncbi:MAG: RDD family protein [Terriglobales bacterium]
MKSRFELDRTTAGHTSKAQVVRDFAPSQSMNPDPTEPRYVDPESLTPDFNLDSALESYDASERHFAISLDKSIAHSSRFIVEEHPHSDHVPETLPARSEGRPIVPKQVADSSEGSLPDSKQRDSLEFFGHKVNQAEQDNGLPWRQEVSARLTKYQARRRAKEPRYPSLQLKFETQETWRSSAAVELCSSPISNTPLPAERAPVTSTSQPAIPRPTFPSPPVESPSRVIEFPRSSTVAPNHSEELAEPVFVRPRIMEAPELVPAAPALGGILIEPVDAPASEKRPGFEMPLQAARMATRLAATLIDALIVFAGVALFACIFWRVTGLIPSMRAAAPILGVLSVILWSGSQYLLVVYCGVTPGLKLARLRLSHFDGSPVPRKMRRWRVLASILSGVSLGLGYAWSFLDEDQLCWHDRITRTYIAPRG